MSHRIIVLRRGSICKEFKRGEAQETDILREAISQVIGAVA
jgi:ABC-type sugar transport system ATPase subunit